MPNMRPFPSICFVVFVSLIPFIQMKDFCDAFTDNNRTISYGFRRIIKSNNSEDLYFKYIFIGHHYWKLNFKDHKSDAEKEVVFDSRDSKESHWFGSNYSMALCVFVKSDARVCTTYLLDKSHKFWVYGELKDNRTVLELEGQKNTVINDQNMTNKLVFVPNWGQTEYFLVVVFNTELKSPYVYKMIDNILLPQKSYLDEVKKVEHKSLRKLSSDPKIVAFFGQYSEQDFLIEKDKWWTDPAIGHGVVILFNDGNGLKYCYTSAKVLSESCKPENLRFLIKCDPKNTTTTTQRPKPTHDDSLNDFRTTTTEPEEEIDWTLVLIIGTIGLIIIIIAIIVIILVYIKENAEKDNVLSGLKPRKCSPRFLQTSGSGSTIGQPSTVSAAKSEAFTVKSNVDYTKPIPLNSKISTTDSTLQ